MFKRLKNLYKLSKKDQKILDKLTDEQIDLIPDEGDGKAVFFGEGSEEEFKEQELEDKGLLAWYKRIGE